MKIVLLVLATLLVVALAVVVLVTWLRRRSRRMREALSAELATEPARRGPESAVYRSCTGGYSQVAGNGQLALTDRRLIFRKATGGHVDVSLTDVTGVTQQKIFKRSVQAGHVHLVVQTRRGDVAFYVTDLEAWTAAITAAVTAAITTARPHRRG